MTSLATPEGLAAVAAAAGAAKSAPSNIASPAERRSWESGYSAGFRDGEMDAGARYANALIRAESTGNRADRGRSPQPPLQDAADAKAAEGKDTQQSAYDKGREIATRKDAPTRFADPDKQSAYERGRAIALRARGKR